MAAVPFNVVIRYGNGTTECFTLRARDKESALHKVLQQIETRWAAKFFPDPENTNPLKLPGRLVNYGGVLYDLMIDCWQER